MRRFVEAWRPTPCTGPGPGGCDERGWLLIADFDNRTVEEVFDGTLEAALERALANSASVNVAPAERAIDSLQSMGRPIDTRVDATLARAQGDLPQISAAMRDGAVSYSKGQCASY